MHPRSPIWADAISYSRLPMLPPQLMKLSFMVATYCVRHARNAEHHIMMTIQLINHLCSLTFRMPVTRTPAASRKMGTIMPETPKASSMSHRERRQPNLPSQLAAGSEGSYISAWSVFAVKR